MDTIIKLYTYYMGHFPVLSSSGNHSIVMDFHIYTNTILVETFQSRQDHHHIAEYNHIMTRLNKRVHTVDLQILDNEASQAYK